MAGTNGDDAQSCEEHFFGLRLMPSQSHRYTLDGVQLQLECASLTIDDSGGAPSSVCLPPVASLFAETAFSDGPRAIATLTSGAPSFSTRASFGEEDQWVEFSLRVPHVMEGGDSDEDEDEDEDDDEDEEEEEEEAHRGSFEADGFVDALV